jgi:hypothetical protein
MPTRLIREGIISSDRVNALDWPAEVFYRRLLNKVDDHGLYDARPSFLRTSLYPMKVDRVREADCSRWLAECETAGLIVLYEAGGKPYLMVLDTRWKTRAAAKYPIPPPETSARNGKQLKTPVAVVGVVVEDEYEVGDGVERRARGTRLLQADFPAEWRLWCVAQRPDLSPEMVWASFRDYWVAKPGKDGVKLDWAATWRNWVRNEKSRAGGAVPDYSEVIAKIKD